MSVYFGVKILHKNAKDLIFAEYNPRQLAKEQHQNLTDSIKRFGLVDPILVNTHKSRKNIIIGGHQRVRIAKELGISEIPCVELKLTPEKEKELNIRLNKNTGEWDWDALANYFDVGELTEWGFTDDELQFYEDEPEQGLIDDDEIPEVEEAITNDKDNVIDYFLGSGSTLIACEKTNRQCYGMEIDPHYCDVIVKRWEDFTGNKAERVE